jgi:hypothetical protein
MASSLVIVPAKAKPVVRARRDIGSRIVAGSLYTINSVSAMGNTMIVRIDQEWWPMHDFSVVWNVYESQPNSRCN